VSEPRELSRSGAYALMHLTVFLWGFTAILGRVITIDAIPLVWYRLVVSTAVLAGLLWWRGLPLRVPRGDALRYAVAGVSIGLHWACFFATIKIAGVPTAVLCLAAVTFFTALIEPIVFRRRVAASELVIGVLVIGGIGLITTLEVEVDALGVTLGLASALFASAFGSMNGRLAHRDRGERVMLYELAAATVTVTGAFAIWPHAFVPPWEITATNAVLIAALAIVCTVLAQLWTLRVLRVLSPFTVAVSVNLEPVYSLVMVLAFFPARESPSWRFYAGTAVLIGLVALNARLKRPTATLA
jgi:drug/metabolite transporter (DMT)-like permease